MEERNFAEITTDYLESFWCLYHKPTKALVDGLSWRQLRAFITTIPKDTISLWLVWREGEVEWSKLGDRIQKIMSAASSHLAHPPLAPDLDSENQTVIRTKTRPALSNAKNQVGSFSVDRRMTKRFNKVVEVMIHFKGKAYGNHTRNISVMGLRLDAEVPFTTEETFQVFLNVEPEPLELICQLNKNESGINRDQLRILPAKNLDKLAEYLSGDGMF